MDTIAQLYTQKMQTEKAKKSSVGEGIRMVRFDNMFFIIIFRVSLYREVRNLVV